MTDRIPNSVTVSTDELVALHARLEAATACMAEWQGRAKVAEAERDVLVELVDALDDLHYRQLRGWSYDSAFVRVRNARVARRKWRMSGNKETRGAA